MKTHFGYVFFLATIGFFLFILVGQSPLQRIERACMPIEWGGKALTSVGSLFSDAAESKTRTATEEVTFSCQYLIYRQFYKEQLAEQRRARDAQSEAREESESRSRARDDVSDRPAGEGE